MIGAAGPRPVTFGLAARIIGFLSVALVPLGVVAYLQTRDLGEETRARSQLSIIAVTEAAAAGERETILRALGGAQALGATAPLFKNTPEACQRYFREYLRATRDFTYAGIVDLDGRITCSSAERSFDVSGTQRFAAMMRHQRSSVNLYESASTSNSSVLIVSEPFFRNDKVAGFVSVSVPTYGLGQKELEEPASDLTELLTYNADGDVLSSHLDREEALKLLPARLDLAELADAPAHSFQARSADGVVRIFATAPLVPGLVHALSIWPKQSRAAISVENDSLARTLPFAMWAASVIVAFLAINRLVIRHIRTLGQQMRAFARTRRLPDRTTDYAMAMELRDMESDFLNMANAILQDEAQLENALREKTILLKEVHHRVKNNLQLISSIMNMQIRQSHMPETREVLLKLQERIRSLATIHRNLYQTEDLGHVNAGQLLGELIRQMAIVSEHPRSRVKLETNLDDIELYPDQAVPLSLLTAEALTNVGKYLVTGPDGAAHVRVNFRRTDERRAVIEISNSCRENAAPSDEVSGLGHRLIRAFATQLGGELEQGIENDVFTIRVEFTLTDFIPDAIDY
ncbi:sensor histidine kinase [Puniceibacterium sp. IMCC21224]|uniref:sensor histidine kinase n=1 Tax=Puniceibacterium sp. IMCC21224 TaxID=1618204 RepID=UPI00064DD7C0|nr:sensor histidine kinase [Puniceibacterium sp. IMCC21224]KMK67616.1 signal transduction histidine kinase [Puniceibacterium sp. IMCC21224]